MKHLFYCVLWLSLLIYPDLAAQPGWNLQTSPVTDDLSKIYFANANEGWISTEGGVVLHTTNGGLLWSVQDPESVDTVTFISSPASPLSFINSATGWVIGTLRGLFNPNGAVLYKTTNGGSSWSRQDLTPWTNGFAIQFVDANNGWAVVATGTLPNIAGAIIRTTDGGVSWTPGYTATNAVVIPFFVDANNGWMMRDTILASGQEADLTCPCELLRTTDAGQSWTRQLRDLTLGGYRTMGVVNVSNAWVVGDSAKVLRTTNGGGTWAPISVSNMRSGSDNQAAFFLTASIGWVGGENVNFNNSVFRTTNGGGTWATQSIPISRSVRDLFFVDANNGWLAAGDGIAHTADGGVTDVRELPPSGIPDQIHLAQNFPNPFNPSTRIDFSIPSSQFITLKVYNLLGKEVATLVQGMRSRGNYAFEWTPEGLPSGVYVCKLTAENFAESRKLILMK